jgi:hypothetical protein
MDKFFYFYLIPIYNIMNIIISLDIALIKKYAKINLLPDWMDV